jgi:hypothetical protein
LYQPDESTVLAALQRRAARRSDSYISLMSSSRETIDRLGNDHGIQIVNRSMHDIVCDLVDDMYPESHAGQSATPSVVMQNPDVLAQFDDTMIAQAATAADLHRFRDVVGEPTEEPGDTWPVDVPEGMAGVGYKAADGSVHFLDSEGSVLLSGWGPEKVRFLLVSLSQFFDGDYIKQLMTDLYVAVCDDSERVRDLVVEVLNDNGWLDEASEVYAEVQASRQPIYTKTASDTDSWATGGVPQEYPVVGTGDAPTEVIDTGEINQYKPGPY